MSPVTVVMIGTVRNILSDKSEKRRLIMDRSKIEIVIEDTWVNCSNVSIAIANILKERNMQFKITMDGNLLFMERDSKGE